jgi:hypothetical protein
MISFIESLLQANTWKRVMMVVAGSILILMALWQSSPVNQLARSMSNAVRLA